MKLSASTLLLPLLVLAGCGGHGGSDSGSTPVFGIQTEYLVTPPTAKVAPGGTVALEAYVLEGAATGPVVAVREGAGDGAVAATGDTGYASVTYTAPNAPGTYHVDATFTDSVGTAAGTVHKASATITVAAK